MGPGRREGVDQGATDHPTGRRLSVPEAAEVLGISADAVRSRIKRGTLPTVREGGRVFVVLGAADRPIAQAQPTRTSTPDVDVTVVLTEQNEYLREQLRREQEAHAEARRIIAGLVQRMPELDAPPEARESTERPAEDGDRVEEGAGPPEGREGDIRRPWWRRVLGG